MVPAGARAGEYLAGVLVRPAAAAAQGIVGGGRAAVTVDFQVAVGVAIRVPGRLQPALAVPSVRLEARSRASVAVTEQDLGNTWEHPAGQLRITSGRVIQTFDLHSATILPGQSATLAVPVSGVRPGRWPTVVDLWYAAHTKLARWQGMISYSRQVTRADGTERQRLSVPGRSARGGSRVRDAMPQGGWTIGWLAVVVGALAVALLRVCAHGRRRRLSRRASRSLRT